MPGPYLIGIDCGTQSAKVVIYDASGAVVSEGRQPLRPVLRPRHGVVVHPDDDLWSATSRACREAIGAFSGDVSDIVGVGLCAIRCCKAFLAADGSLVEPVISWMDDRAYQPYLPDTASLAYATTLSGYMTHRFTGEFRDTAANNIVSQWPIDADTWRWSDDPAALAALNVVPELLVELVSPGEVLGAVSAAAAAETGIPTGVPVIATANDKAVEMLAAGALGPSSALLSLGTYIAAMMNGGRNIVAPTNFWTNFGSIPHRYLYESHGVRRGMWTLTWFLDLLGSELADRVASLGISREEHLEREAAAVPAGSDGLMTVLDWLAPTDHPFRKGLMLGFDARHTRGHIYRSILEAIALTMTHNVDAMSEELGVTLDEIVVSGGGSSSPLFMQIIADAFDMPAARSLRGGASLGAAMCVAAATGVHADIESASRHMASAREVFEPDAATGAVYRSMLDSVYLDIRAVTDPLLARAYPIFHHQDLRSAEDPS